jgi:RNA polymerase sigma-70 factor (ECF subfamily)
MESSPDERLRQIFACCDPVLESSDQVALALHTVGGLTYREVARAFLLPTTSVARRLMAAQSKLREVFRSRESLDVVCNERLPAVMSTLYLLFNEGHAATDGRCLIRGPLCDEAIVLTRLLRTRFAQPPAELDSLLSLMLLSDSRRGTRVDPSGEPVPLGEQDRTRWDQEMIAEGCKLLKDARRREPPGQYALQASIAAVHAAARRAEDTDWREIAKLYECLFAIHPSPIVALNHAVAVSMYESPAIALRLVDELHGDLADHPLWHATRADLLRRMGRADDAISSYRRALALVENEAEHRFIFRQLRDLGARSS